MTTRKEFNDTVKKHIEALKENTVQAKKLEGALIFVGKGLGTLAKETGDWRQEDNKNHSNEAGQRKEAIKILKEIRENFPLRGSVSKNRTFLKH